MMTPWLDQLAASPLAGWAALGALWLKLTLVAVAGCVVLALTRHASAARRHLVATTTLAVMLALPLAHAWAPRWELPILPVRTVVATTRQDPPPAPAVSGRLPAEALPSRPSTVRSSASTALSGAGREAQAAPVRRAPSFASLANSAPAAPPLPWSARIALVGIGVTVLLGLLLLAAIVGAARLARRCDDVADPALCDALERARARLGVRRRVALKTGRGLAVPVVAGVFRPALLMPAAAADWPAGRLRAVLLHELAHVRRGDAMSLLLARAATAACWFHPLAWLLARVARSECERACDDLVIASGIRPSEYAEELLWVARTARTTPRGAVLAFARPSSLEQRLVAILRTDVRRGVNSRRAMGLALAVAALVLGPLGALRLVAVPAAVAAAREEAPDDLRSSILELPALERSWDLGATGHARSGEAREPEVAVAETAAEAMPAQLAPALAPDDEAAEESPTIVTADFDGRIDKLGWRTGGGWFERARSLYQEERWAEAAEAYRRAARGGHRPGTSLYNAACSYALAGRTEAAFDALEEAIDAGWDNLKLMASDEDLESLRDDPRYARLVREVRQTPAAERERRPALARYEALRSSRSQDADAWRSVGIELLRAGSFTQAARAFEEQIEIEPVPNAHYNLACALGLGGEEERGLEALERAVLAGYSDPDHMRSDADLAPLRDDPRFDELVELARDLQLYDQGRGDGDRDGWRRAIPRFERVTRQHPDVGRAWFNLGFARLKTRDAEGGYEAFEKALALDYRVPTTRYNLACAAAQMGEVDEALRWLDRAKAAGMNVEDSARGDSDLDPLRRDPRFRERLARWAREGRRSEKDEE